MSVMKLYDSIDRLLWKDNANDKEIFSMEFRIDMLPNSIVFGGDYALDDGSYAPINLKQVGKYNCHLFTEFLNQFHKEHTDEGRSKWNRARIKKHKSGNFESTFIWDGEWEKDEIKSYLDSGSERGKWYWDEK